MNNHIKTKTIAALALGAAILGLQSVAAPAETAKPMRIGIIGAGSLGGTVGSVLVKAGHQVKFSSRHPEELAAMAKNMGRARPREGRAKRRSLERCCCLPFRMKLTGPDDLQSVIARKIVLDATPGRQPRSKRSGDEWRWRDFGEAPARHAAGARF